MAYNISVKFSEPADRWRWVSRGMELIRDEGIRYNPHETLLYHELAWHYQHKMGQNLDDAHWYYKQQWAEEMEAVLGTSRTNLAELLNPRSPELMQRAELLKTKYKLDPQIMKEVDDEYGPLEWRLPEAHAIYWAVAGLKASSGQKQNPFDLRTLRRVVYQSMQQSVRHGRVISMEPFRLGPDLAKVESANRAYENMIEEESDITEAVKMPHRNFLREAVTMLYINGRRTDAERWFAVLKDKYPESMAPGITVEELTMRRYMGGDFTSLGHDQVKAAIEGMLAESIASLAVDNDDSAQRWEYLAFGAHSSYTTNIVRGSQRLALPPFIEMKREVLSRFLDPNSGLDPRVVDRLRSKLGLPAGTNAPPGAPEQP
jgi:hypothetical protein